MRRVEDEEDKSWIVGFESNPEGVFFDGDGFFFEGDDETLGALPAGAPSPIQAANSDKSELVSQPLVNNVTNNPAANAARAQVPPTIE